MQVIVLGNIALDETFGLAALPEQGASIAAIALGTGLGGKGANQAIALARALGERAALHLVAALGDDLSAQLLEQLLAPEPLHFTPLRRKGMASDRSIILREAAGDNAVITTQALAQSITPEEAASLLAKAQSGDVLVMQGNLTPATTEAALTIAGQRGMLRVFNPSPTAGCTARHLALSDLIVVNEEEARHFAADLPDKAMVLRTLGKRGAIVTQGASVLAKAPAQKVEALDPTGAGDCFLAAAVAAMILRQDRQLNAADLAFAAAAAALTVTRLGTQTAFPSLEEFAALRAK